METMTNHATARMRQRGIKPSVMEALMLFGTEVHDHHGATILYFDKRARHRVEKQFGAELFRDIRGQLDAYAVVGENGAVLTVGHRTKRILRH